ncbi:MAG: DNA (cytosine-5-)-methyltransferase [Bacteroidales bacterium]|nr:DNA (cytosine-5-)-methyltransferase [Bacteroidales bacterium]
MKNNSKRNKIEVVDLFCGIGGLSYGLKSKGFVIKGGFDIDGTCKYAYEQNNKAPFFHQDIKTVTKEQVEALYSKNAIKVLAGCAPCQPFSSMSHSKKEKDPNKYDLLYEFGRLISEIRPDIVTMENVPQIMTFKLKPVFPDFIALLKNLGYKISYKTIYCPDYGVPQTRRRLALIAAKKRRIEFVPATHGKEEYVTVGEVIGDLPPLRAGEKDPRDPLHRAIALSPLNMRRMIATPYGGSWRDWPEELMLECHKKDSGKTYGSVYGRMVWEKPASTMTTECTGFGNGRFAHPTQNRAITPREAAIFQTFPRDYVFFEDEASVSITKAARYIGNAVPPRLGEIIAESIICDNQIK